MSNSVVKSNLEAFHYDGTNATKIQEWSNDRIIESPVLEPTKRNPTGRYLQIKNNDKWDKTAIVGDWVVKLKSNDVIAVLSNKKFKKYSPILEKYNEDAHKDLMMILKALTPKNA
jgi:hypothetical protein